MSDRLHGILDIVLAAIDKLPNPPRECMKAEFNQIKEMLVENRAPRIMIIGRRGAGKSSLINAIFNDQVAKVGAVLSQTGAPEWYTFKNPKGGIRILDTRGLGDLTRPESSNFATALEEIKAAIIKECPDALLFLCKAKEVDAHISDDLANVIQIRDFVYKQHGYPLPLVAITTQVDELDPKRIEPPFDHVQKKANIASSVKAIENACKGSGLDAMKVIPVSAYAEYENGKQVFTCYWNIDTLVDFLIDVLPRSAQLQLAKVSAIRKVQAKVARILIKSVSTLCGGIAAVPIPIADIIPITTAQIAMIMGIGFISGREMTKTSAIEFMTAMGLNVGAGFALREAARSLIKFVFPGGGLLISAGIAAAGTWGIGESAIAYFIDGKNSEEAKEAFNKGQNEHEDTKE